MEFIKPKDFKGKKVDWTISEHTEAIITAYAMYVGYTESEVADNFLKNLTKDEKFKNWIEKKRNNRRIKRLLDIIER